MEPDQWFRLWLTIGSSIGTGLTVVLGGVITYRFAIRHEQRKLIVESLGAWQKRLFVMSKLVNTKLADYESEVDGLKRDVSERVITDDSATDRLAVVRQDFYSSVLDHWREQILEYPEPRGTPPNALVLEVLAEIFEMIDHMSDEGMDWPYPERLADVVDVNHAQCSRWILQGLPAKREVKRRHQAAVLRLKPIAAFQGITDV